MPAGKGTYGKKKGRPKKKKGFLERMSKGQPNLRKDMKY